MMMVLWLGDTDITQPMLTPRLNTGFLKSKKYHIDFIQLMKFYKYE